MARQHVSMKGRGRAAFLPEPESEPMPPAAVEAAPSQPAELSLKDLWLDDQPRRIVPDETLARLIAEGRARPAALLEELRAIAGGHTYYRGVLRALEELARTIEANGVLEPLLVVRQPTENGERFVLRDGHRRSLGSLLAGKETAPVRFIDEASALQSTTQQLVVNIQRQDLTALEKGRWLLRLARLVEAQLREERGLPGDASVVDDLVASISSGPAEVGTEGVQPSSHVRTEAESPDLDGPQLGSHVRTEGNGRALAAAVRDRVASLTGLGRTAYYQLLYLNRLTPDAQEAGLSLTEGQLRPVTSLPPADQVGIVHFIAERRLTSKEAASLVQVAKSGDRDAVKRVMAKLAKEDIAPSRSAVSWEPLLHALPKDLWVRCASLRAELAALPGERRQVRLRSLAEQRRLAEDFARQIDEILALYPSDAGAPSEGE